jgi:hypothetical protein
VFIDGQVHAQLKAVVALRASGGDGPGELQGQVDEILTEWLTRHPVRSFLPEEAQDAGQQQAAVVPAA